ncbi:hypothetical protein CEP54_008526 [Fusarium duplospermum]|uniref:Uncharacterized protein n=1 Tax=Fusarium duplospermum TaxID=1325734 RepID=A0A428PVG9_9HYPO|nr:hypothetical protein CEP54_008526 [Fusarium duplospermum]
MVFIFGVALVAFLSFCAAKSTAPTEAQRLAIIFEKSLITNTVLTSAYDIEDKDKKFHCAACSNKLTISDLKLDVEFDVDDHAHGTLRVSESHFTIDETETSKAVSGIRCSTSYSKDHVRAECVVPLDHHHKPLSRPSVTAKPVGRVHQPHRPHHPHHPHFRHRVGPQRVHDESENTAYAPAQPKVERLYSVKPDSVPRPVHDDEGTRPYARQPGREVPESNPNRYGRKDTSYCGKV